MSSVIALGGTAILGLSTFNNIQKGGAAFETSAGRACMHISHFFLTCCASQLTSSFDPPNLFWLAMSVGGAALYATKWKSNIQNAENRFQTSGARAFETLGNIGGALAIIQLGKCIGLSPMDTAYYTSMGLYQAASSICYHSARLAAQVGLGFLFGNS